MRDGLTIRGYEYRPQGEQLPIAIVSYGFMANLMTVKHYAKSLASMGYAAFCFDFNGGSVIMGKTWLMLGVPWILIAALVTVPGLIYTVVWDRKYKAMLEAEHMED